MTKAWRDLVAGEVNWAGILPAKNLRTTGVIFRTCRASPHDLIGEWSAKTIGEICDMGVREWQRVPGWGESATAIFKDALRRIAKDPTIAFAKIASDAFDPETM